MRAALPVLALALVGAGCDDGGAGECPEPEVRLRNPENLVCEQWHVPSPTCPDQAEPPTWPSCADPCVVIRDEGTCLDQAGCRPAYDDCILFDEPCYGEGNLGFIGCFGVDLAGPVAGDCATLDAQDCSSREDCAAWFHRGPTCPPGDPYLWQPDGEKCVLAFASCAAEPPAPLTARATASAGSPAPAAARAVSAPDPRW